jgi:hypothetical protein
MVATANEVARSCSGAAESAENGHRRVAEGKHTELAAPSTFEAGSNAVMILDELRISDIPREELEMSNEVKKETPYKPLEKQEARKELPSLPHPPSKPQPIELRSGLPNLFIDDYLIESKKNLIRRLGQVRKYENNPVISPEGIWEETAAFPFSGGMFRLAEGKWVMFYNTYIRWMRGEPPVKNPIKPVAP